MCDVGGTALVIQGGYQWVSLVCVYVCVWGGGGGPTFIHIICCKNWLIYSPLHPDLTAVVLVAVLGGPPVAVSLCVISRTLVWMLSTFSGNRCNPKII